MNNIFDLFIYVTQWFSTHILTIQIFNISLLSWFIGIIVVGLIISFFATFTIKFSAIRKHKNRENKKGE